jgi:hypothetical protein
MVLRSNVAALLAIATMLASAGFASAEIDGDRYRSKPWKVRVTAPKDWQISEQTSYPNVLLWMVRRNPSGRMLLTAEKHKEKIDALAYATRTIAVLEKMSFNVRKPQLHSATGAYWIDFDNCHEPTKGCEGKMFLRQAFLVVDGIGYALTLAADDTRTRGRHLHAFDYTLRSIRIDRAHTPTTPTAPQPEPVQ